MEVIRHWRRDMQGLAIGERQEFASAQQLQQLSLLLNEACPSVTKLFLTGWRAGWARGWGQPG